MRTRKSRGPFIAMTGCPMPSAANDQERSRPVISWLAIAGIALGLRLLAAAVTGAFLHPQVYEPDAMARSLLAGRGLVYVSHGGVPYYSFIAPLYPLICAGIYALTGGRVAAVLVVQMVTSAVHAGLIAAMGARLFKDQRAGVLSGLLVACHPGLMIYSSLKAHPLTFDALCVTLVWWQFLRLKAKRTWVRSAGTGVMVGISILSRATSAVFLPVGVVWLFATISRRRWLAACRYCALLIVCALVVISPWLVRNAFIHHRVLFLSTTWEVFWRGNNPQATGHSYREGEQTVFEALPASARAELSRLPDELQQARWFRDQALTFIRDHPWGFIELTIKKFVQFWWFTPQSGTLYPRLWVRGYQLFYLLLIWLVFVGVQRLLASGTSSQRQAVLLIGGFLVSLSGLQSFYYVEGRHRWAVEPFLVLLAGYGLSQLLNLRQVGWGRSVDHEQRRADNSAHDVVSHSREVLTSSS